MRHVSFAWCAVALILALARPAASQDEAKRVDPVVVTATTVETPASQLGAQVRPLCLADPSGFFGRRSGSGLVSGRFDALEDEGADGMIDTLQRDACRLLDLDVLFDARVQAGAEQYAAQRGLRRTKREPMSPRTTVPAFKPMRMTSGEGVPDGV